MCSCGDATFGRSAVACSASLGCSSTLIFHIANCEPLSPFTIVQSVTLTREKLKLRFAALLARRLRPGACGCAPISPFAVPAAAELPLPSTSLGSRVMGSGASTCILGVLFMYGSFVMHLLVSSYIKLHASSSLYPSFLYPPPPVWRGRAVTVCLAHRIAVAAALRYTALSRSVH